MVRLFIPESKMKDNHFDKIFLYVCFTAVFILGYVVMITFLPIPKENQRFVDIALAFLLGFISNNSSYLTGGNPQQQKKPVDPNNSTGDQILEGDSVTINKE